MDKELLKLEEEKFIARLDTRIVALNKMLSICEMFLANLFHKNGYDKTTCEQIEKNKKAFLDYIRQGDLKIEEQFAEIEKRLKENLSTED